MRRLSYLVRTADELGELQLLRPWIPTWINDYDYWLEDSISFRYARLEENLVRLGIAWRLGEKEFLKQFTFGGEGHRLPPTYQVLPSTAHIARLLSNIVEKRKTVMGELLGILSHFQKDWATGMHYQCIATGVISAEKAACESRLQEEIKVAQNSDNARELKAETKSSVMGHALTLIIRITNISWYHSPWAPPGPHDQCNPMARMDEPLFKVRNSIESPMDEAQEEFLDSQAELTGADELSVSKKDK
ncbi:hypothetical protein PG994_001022 [Apiospora phragmitis]|uniref:Uncharacterized protein n=1 Tax=Apiospora phragmitis TaxID=2905665 RepID=A0ABR1WRE4_9PEZI